MAASLQKMQLFAHKNGCFLMGAYVAAFFFSTLFTSIFLIFLGLIWLFTQQYQAIPKLLKSSPTTIFALLIYSLLMVGLSYGNATNAEGWYSLSKYNKILFIPILMIFFYDGRYRRWAWVGFMAAGAITVIHSDLKALGLLNFNPHYATATVKNRITHSIFVAFFAFYCMSKSYSTEYYRKIYLALSLLSLHNLFFVVEGRTGQIAGLALIVLFALQRLSKKGFLMVLVTILIFLAVFLNFSDKSKRFNEGIVNSKAYLEHNLNPKLRKNSAATRYIYWEYSVNLIAEKPLLGHGTGSFSPEFKRIAIQEKNTALHAHNELLMIGVQLGLLGIVVYLGFIVSQYYSLRRLAGEDKFIAQGFLLTQVIISIFNCPIYDHAQGLWVITLIALCFTPIQDNSSQENYA
jgi:O-antigen ligase